MNEILRVENLKKYYPIRKNLWGRAKEVVRAVNGINFAIYEGETLSLVGESGCGKTTIGRLILKLIEADEGRIWFQGCEISKLSRKAMKPFRTALQTIFQDPFSSLNPRMKIESIIEEGLKRSRKFDPSQRKEKVYEIMEKVGLRPEHAGRYPHEFSGGQRQRIGIARAIIQNPRLVVADEPLSALDVSIQAQIINLLTELKEEFGFSYLFISHDLSIVEYISDRVAVMYMGKIVELGTTDQIYDNGKHPYTEALLSAVPAPRIGARKRRIILKGEPPDKRKKFGGCSFYPRCNYHVERCQAEEPKLTSMAPRHFVACFNPLDGALKG